MACIEARGLRKTFGRVVAVAGTGRDQKVVVDFGTLGRKTVFARFLAAEAAGDDLN